MSNQLPENWTDKEVMEDSTIVLYPEADGQWSTQEERDATEYLSAKEADWEDMSYNERKLMVQWAVNMSTFRKTNRIYTEKQ